MDATGPPAKMVENREDLTPMMAQYLELSEAYEDSLVLFQNGDFYQSYCETARTVARICEVALTQREDSSGCYRMAGVPLDNAASYVERLLDAGHRVAIAEQVEDAAEATGLVDRAVTQVVTPGTVVDDELLETDTATYVACVVTGEAAGANGADTGDGDSADCGASDGGSTHALAAIDVSTGDCLVTSADSRERIGAELARIDPAELLVAPASEVDPADVEAEFAVSEFDPGAFEREAARERVSAYVGRPAATVDNDAELRACGALLAYAEYTQGGDRLSYVSRIARYDPREYLQLDATAIRSLELFESRGHRPGETLVDVLDETACALGRRRLARWLRRPLVERAAVEARHDAVGELVERSLVRETVRDRLADVYDLERLIGRISRERADARDLRSLKATLEAVPDVREALADAECDRLRTLREDLDELADVRSLIGDSIRPDPPQEITEGGVVSEGFDDDLDALRATEREGREWVADLEASERERTGIDSLEVGYNQVHGYYIEVTDPNLDRVPEDYRRRQTLKNAERFYTPELKRREDEILSAAERADRLEYELFADVRSDVAAETERVQALAEALATLDVLASLAAVAVENDYIRPTIRGDNGDGIDVEGGRHPVVERARESFVPNGASLDRGEMAVITGPNMSGKSTYMRQVALIVVLAQVGSFVPADAARLPIVDRVFTRVGASDDIAGGQSTFMREMAELTEILRSATADSLVLLDEVGRGTSTADGLAIAWATAEYIHDEVGCFALFATHYHDLTALADRRERVSNLHFTAERDADAPGGEVTFLHRVEHGAASSSYGVEVARMAGVPEAVVERSRVFVEDGVPGQAATVERGAETARQGGVSTTGPSGAETNDQRDAETDGEATARPAASTASDGTTTDGEARPGVGDLRTNGRTRSDGDARTTDGETRTADGEARAVDGETSAGATASAAADSLADTSAADGSLAAVAAELRSLDVARTTPLEALRTLDDLKRRLDD